MRLVILGASGMVGGYALSYMLNHPTIERVTAIGRRKLGVSHPKLVEVLHQDFSNCASLAQAASDQDGCIFCLGTYTGTVSDAELKTITVDYTIEFARVLRASSPDAAFAFLSGAGADQTGRSRIAYARYKGEAEKALLAAGFPSVYIFRPAYIYPVEPRREPNFSYRLLRVTYLAIRVHPAGLGPVLEPSASAQARTSEVIANRSKTVQRLANARAVANHPGITRSRNHFK